MLIYTITQESYENVLILANRDRKKQLRQKERKKENRKKTDREKLIVAPMIASLFCNC